ncbi:MAG: gamma-glutamyl-gamma-aminobutyrate hydrolase family protein [Mariprofundaceae bacterium]|nr:gamma-glutamyl-gamma-aminobutyrate hydrolase family protein [Mariprofundaceae bacterium]
MRFLVLQHLDIEPPALIADCLLEAGHTLETVHIHKRDAIPGALSGYAGLIVMGGPMSANDKHLPFIGKEIHLLQQAIAQDFPVLGICLGAQLLAKAAGAKCLAITSSFGVEQLKEADWFAPDLSAVPDEAINWR